MLRAAGLVDQAMNMTIGRALTCKARSFCNIGPKSAVVLLSGGLDSATALAIAHAEGFRTYTLCFDYGQRHRHEILAAERIAKHLGAYQHHIAKVDVNVFQGSALTTASVEVPKLRTSDEMKGNIPVTYVPARNTLFLSYGLALAESVSASDIYIGANQVDYSGYPDCRAEFFHNFQRVADVGTKMGVEGHAPKIRTPLLHCTKREIIERGLQLGVDYALTHSCYDPDTNGRPCGECDSCMLRAEAFTELGFPVDPALAYFLHQE